MLDPLFDLFFDRLSNIASAPTRKKRLEAILALFVQFMVIFGLMGLLALVAYQLIQR